MTAHLSVPAWLVVAAGNPLPQVSPVAPPGSAEIAQLLGWVMWGAVAVCLVGAIVAGGQVAIGHYSERPRAAVAGRNGFLWCLAGAFLIALARVAVGLAFNLGTAGG